MKKLWLGVAYAALCASASGAAAAQEMRAVWNGIELTATGEISVQHATFDDPETSVSDDEGNWDGSLVLNAERVSDSGLIYGARFEFDTGDRVSEDLQRDELYIYVAGDFGRAELGEQDGPADTIALHAPVLGLGQIRGDFVRYAGAAALLSPFDSRDALKVLYLSAPNRGFRYGVSYAPQLESNSSDPVLTNRTDQRNVVELAAAQQASFGDWVGAVSLSYVTGDAEELTGREDIESWSIGAEIRRDRLSIGAAFVSAGDSNSLTPGLDVEEYNAGIAWRETNWGLGLSASMSESLMLDNQLIGIGGFYEFNEHIVFRADFVSIKETRPVIGSERGSVALAEVAFVF